MDEKRQAAKIADIFSDDRLNVVALANYTQFMMTRRGQRKMQLWVEWHNRFLNEPDDLDEFDV